MSTSTIFSRTQGSTANVPVAQRLEYWDAYNATALVGLRCSSLSQRGLQATTTNIVLKDLCLADIMGNDHIIERSPALVRQYPKDSVFACQIVHGSAYFIQNERCTLIDTGETIVYDTRYPYLFGFLSEMRQFLIDIPVSAFAERFGIDLSGAPLKLTRHVGTGAMLGATLRSTLDVFFKDPVKADLGALVDHAGALLEAMIDCEIHGERHSRSSMSYLLTARQYIAQRLGDPELTPQSVADAAGISLRHLNRMFAAEDQSISAYIWSKRASHAHADLMDPMLAKTTVSEIGFRWGFSSQAHFSRAIRDRFGASPNALREIAAGSCKAQLQTGTANC
ncbi:helix-turn-helix domain-containing protein [Paraburkholderia antibiotica]|uniref:Helix-turn-helix domain-containing protein n=1 Tax=Paraburkholderia antibiotica TaxID=2728839 RepID=A0A7X9ZWT2_9BURK|nr:helix-turn-helix domain-containing protein [Paraburkholderia antibiotica]NML31494.1 helix-turn-helix domain-containing protein [Paraburkholderia antibiotica]